MKISIIIPVYNVAPYVEQCIKSVLSQDYEDIEIIIVDDCSTDNSMELVREMLKETSRTVYILTHQYNRGLSAARNTGIMRATGEYIYFIDSDDYIESDCISSLVKTAQIYPKAEMIIGSSKAVPAGINFVDFADRADLKEYYDDRNQIKKMMLVDHQFPYVAWNRLINRDWLLKHGLFFKEGIIFEDLHWTFFAAKYITGIAFYKRNIYYYRYNPDGIMASTNMQKTIENYDIIVKDWLGHIDSRRFLAQVHIMIIYARCACRLRYVHYIQKLERGDKPCYIKILYPLIYLPMYIYNKAKRSG